MKKIRLLTPGPTPVPEETLLELAKPVFFHRTAEFRQILAEVAHLIVRESRGRLDRGHSEIVALALIGMVETVAQREPGGPPERRREAVDLLVRLAWRGITELDQ